jgi:hypothetical protein
MPFGPSIVSWDCVGIEGENETFGFNASQTTVASGICSALLFIQHDVRELFRHGPTSV